MCFYQISYNFLTTVVNKVSLVFVQIFNPFSKVENSSRMYVLQKPSI